MTMAYALHGLRVRSEIPIDAPIEDGLDPDVEIQWGGRRSIVASPPTGEVLRSQPDVSTWLVVNGPRYLLRCGDWCEFEFDRDLRAVVAYVAQDGDKELASVFVGTVLSDLLGLRSRCVLHASAVQVSSGAVAFVGESGGGKSTVAALCCAAGTKIFSDDVLRLEVTDGRAWCYRGALTLRLRPEAAELAQRINGTVSRVSADERTLVSPPAAASARLPLSAIVAPLCNGGEEHIQLTRLHGIDAALELVKHPRTLGRTDPATARQDLPLLTRTAELVPVYRARLPWGPPFREDLGVQLLAELGYSIPGS